MASNRTRLLGPALAAVLAVAAWCGSAALADIIYLEDGGKIRGEIVKETDHEVVIKTSFGSTHVVPRDEIRSIEREGDPVRELDDRWKKLSPHDADGFAALGDWAKHLPALAHDAARRSRMVEAGQRLVERHWQMPEIIGQWRRLLTDVAGVRTA